jgi:MoaA/NifB/PqqE/SkfB family radical SAM enzyme
MESAQDLIVDHCRPPTHFYIDIGNVCNLRCPFCVTGAGINNQSQGLMSLASFEIILAKIRNHAQLISLYNWGEPLLNKSLVPMIRLVAASGIRAHIDTNLAVRDIDNDEAVGIVSSGLHSLFASIDGITQATYEKYRVRGKLNRVFANLQKLLEAKLRLSSPTPFLGWQFHVHRFNEHEIESARVLANRIGVPIVFKYLSSWDPKWRATSYVAGANQMFVEHSEWFNRIYNPQENPDLAGILFHPTIRSHHPCHQQFQTMVVEWNGDVYPCTVVSGKQFVLGNLLRQGFEEIWNGAAFSASRTFVLNYGPRQGGNSVCENNACPLQGKIELPIEFDATRYLEVHQDVAEAGMDAAYHYANFGYKEGRRLR